MKLLDEYLKCISKESNVKRIKSGPLLSWDIFMEEYHKRLRKMEKINEFEKVNSLRNVFNWENRLKSIFKNKEYDALIITDKSQKIIWVSSGFCKMTGYSKAFALNKTPKFLQGPSTCNKTKATIRHKLSLGKSFSETIINYKKDNSSYTCAIKIIPLYNKEITHFIAFEKTISPVDLTYK